MKNKRTLPTLTIPVFSTRWIKPVLLAISILATQTASAEDGELVIDIVKDAVKAPKIAIVPFLNSSTISTVITEDLNLSGQLTLDNFLPETPHNSQSINIPTWQAAGVPYVVVGSVKQGQGSHLIQYELVNTGTSNRMLGEALTVPKGKIREAGHHIADKVYEAIIGKKSDFSGKLAFISHTGRGKTAKYSLKIANTDGSSAQTLFTSSKPIRSLTWSADARKLAYVSYASGRPHIYVLDVYSGKSRPVVQFKGTNGAPSFSPDGRKLLFSSSKNGNFDIYLKNIATGSVRNLTRSRGTDTEPSFAPDGKSFVFVSNRSGSPQIYQYFFLTGQTRRLTLVGKYNTRPSLSKDGTKLSLIHNYRASVMDIASGAIKQLGRSGNDESPSFSPNGDVMVYSTKAGGKDIITMISTNGKTRVNMPSAANVREPVWAPKR